MIRVLISYDVDGWAYHRRALALQKFAPEDVNVTIARHANTPWDAVLDHAFDVLFVLDYTHVFLWQSKLGGRQPFIMSFNKDHRSRAEDYVLCVNHAPLVIVNNVDRFETGEPFLGDPSNIVCISNGVDMDVFKPTVPIEDRPHRCLWTGSSNPKKMKGYQEVISKLPWRLEPFGFSCSFRPIDTVPAKNVLDEAGMVQWYNSGSYVLCASRSEGTPNTILEGMACDCVAVSTVVGNVGELHSDDNTLCVVDDATPLAFCEALGQARDTRDYFSLYGRGVLQENGWHWADRSQYFYQLFRRVAAEGVESIKPFRYDRIEAQDI